MLAIIGIILLFAAVFVGYMMERGNLLVLMQPAELLIIVGAAIGIILVANPWTVIRKMLRGVVATFRRSGQTEAFFLRNLRMLYEVFVYSQRAGNIMALEKDVAEPRTSVIFSNHPE